MHRILILISVGFVVPSVVVAGDKGLPSAHGVYLEIELDRHELQIVGVAGRIDEILAQAIADEPGELSGLFGP